MTASYLFALLLLSVVCSIGALKRVAIFGITGGVSQLLSRELLGSSRDVIVRGITRQDTGSLGAKFELLNDKRLTLLKADPRVQDERLRAAVAGCDAIVINIGTTAFPTAKWEDGKNNPKIACVETVANILNAIKSSKSKPGQVILLSSIGVERLKQFPFSLLNAYGVLDCKLQSERLLADAAAEIDFSSIAVRPGRLVGEPFTNFDLAKLLGQKQSILRPLGMHDTTFDVKSVADHKLAMGYRWEDDEWKEEPYRLSQRLSERMNKRMKERDNSRR